MHRFIKHWSAFLLVSVLLTVMPATVYAHPGRTDGNGGHTDSDTDDYHYHHGYPAHDHYDIDGDGKVDCPYDFDDKTNTSNGGSHNGNGNNDGFFNSGNSKSPAINDSEGGSEMPPWVYWAIAGGCFIVLMLFLYAKKDNEIEALRLSIEEKEREIHKLKRDHQEQIKLIQLACENAIRDHLAAKEELDDVYIQLDSAKSMPKALTKRIEQGHADVKAAEAERRRINKAPLDVYWADDGMPVYWKPNPLKPYGDYTVFISPKSKIYHVDRYCASFNSMETHIFNVIRFARPCKKCAEGFFDFTTIPEWYARNDTNNFEF